MTYPTIFSLLLVLFLSSLAPSSASAVVVRGEVVRLSAPYLLLKTASGHEVVKVQRGATLGNITSLGELKRGGIRVECSGEPGRNGIIEVTRVAKSTVFKATADMEITPGQAAAWRDLPSGPDRHLLVDVRSRAEWEEGHIQGAINAPFGEGFAGLLPRDTSLGLVFHAADTFSDLPHRAARAALAAGHAKVRVYSGGLADWRNNGSAVAMAASGVARIMELNEPLLILDIRSAADWTQGHVKGSISAPPGSFTREMVLLKGRNFYLPLLIIGYGDEDGRAFLRDPALAGYHNNGPVAYLEGGMAAWRSSGLPLTAGAPPPKLAALAPAGEISFEEFSALWKERKNEAVALVNMQEEDLKLPGILHVPFTTLAERIQDLPRDRELIIFCYTGIKANIAYHLLKNNGFRSRFLNMTVDIGDNGELIE